MTWPQRKIFTLLCLFVLTVSHAFASEQIFDVTDKVSATDSGLLILELNEDSISPASLFDLDNKTLRFTPESERYSLELLPSQFIEDTGSLSNIGDEQPIQNFQFPFSGEQWRNFYVNGFATVSFGQRDTSSYSAFSPLTDHIHTLLSDETPPLIAPLFHEAIVSNIRTKQFSDHIVLTWDVSPFSLETPGSEIFSFLSEPQSNIFQLVLFESGVIDLNYKNLEMQEGIVGIFPRNVQSQIEIEDLLGTYRLEPYMNDFHQGEIFQDNGLKWRNLAGTEWNLDASTLNELRLTTSGSPYENQDDTDFHIEEIDGSVTGFRFLGEFYGMQTDSVIPSQSKDLSNASSDLTFSRAYEVFSYASKPNMREIACSIISATGDNYDFLASFSQFRMDKQFAGSPMYITRNTIGGIGQDLFTDDASHCSENRLTAVIASPMFIDSSLATPAGPNSLDDNYNYALAMLGHELTHNWIANVNAIVDGLTINLRSLDCNCHWIEGLHAPVAHPWVEDLQASAMGGGYWSDNGTGTFTRFADAFFVPASGFSYLDLYLMGFLSPEDVPDFFILDNLTYLSEGAQNQPLYSGDRIDISIEDIIDFAGPRSPAYSESQKDFNTAFVYLLEPGTEVIQHKFNRMAEIRDHFVDYWSFTTGGVSSMNQSLIIGQNVGPTSATDGTVSSAVITGGVTIQGTDHYSDVVSKNEHATISGVITPNPSHIGSLGDLYALIILNGQILYLDSDNELAIWDGTLEGLGAHTSNVEITAIMSTDMHNGPMTTFVGNHSLYFAYGINGVLYYNTDPINFSVQE